MRWIGEVIVVELGTNPLATEVTKRWADKHLFIEHAGPFERARALNAGEVVADYELLLWHDNDLIIPPDFVVRAFGELRDRRLDYMIPYTVISYLSPSDSKAVMSGVRSPKDCKPVNRLYSGRHVSRSSGTMGLVRREFLRRHGGLLEGFRGWGGEDNAWNHKASLYGRVAPTSRKDQEVHHLYHEGSGGYQTGFPGDLNPHYAENVALLKRVLSVRTASEFSRQFANSSPSTGLLTHCQRFERSTCLHEDNSPSSYERIFSRFLDQYRLGRCESLSGPGSSLFQTKELREKLPIVLESLRVRSLLDAPCGDHNWMQHVRLPLERYIGVDILNEIIAVNKIQYASKQKSFMRADLTRHQLPAVDAILCRDLLPHLSFADISAVLASFKRSGATYLLTTTFTSLRPNLDSPTGGWRTINLTAPPFNFPAPKIIINEKCTEGDGSFADKSLGVWELALLPTDMSFAGPNATTMNRCDPHPTKPSPVVLAQPARIPADTNVLPIWTYWEGPCPEWINACSRTISAFSPQLIHLSPETFDRLWDRDRDINLKQLHAPHRADFVRAFLLWRYGGLWIDSDCLVMQPLKSILNLLNHHDFVGHRERAGLISNAFIAARPNSEIAAKFYRRVCGILRRRQPLAWNAIGADPLSAIVAENSEGWHELPCERVQPVCWSQPEKFFEIKKTSEHERVFDPDAICYMLSNGAVNNYLAKHPGSDLMQSDTFFSFLLGRALRGVGEDAPSSYERIFRGFSISIVLGGASLFLGLDPVCFKPRNSARSYQSSLNPCVFAHYWTRHVAIIIGCNTSDFHLNATSELIFLTRLLQ